jgi:hypothetical protein
MEPKPFGFHRTEGANNQIEQGDAFFFARNLIGVTYNQLTAMLTDAIHTFSHIASFGMLGVREDAYQTLNWRGVLERMVCQRVNLLYADC